MCMRVMCLLTTVHRNHPSHIFCEIFAPDLHMTLQTTSKISPVNCLNVCQHTQLHTSRAIKTHEDFRPQRYIECVNNGKKKQIKHVYSTRIKRTMNIMREGVRIWAPSNTRFNSAKQWQPGDNIRIEIRNKTHSLNPKHDEKLQIMRMCTQLNEIPPPSLSPSTVVVVTVIAATNSHCIVFGTLLVFVSWAHRS